MAQSKRAWLLEQLTAQQRWMDEHGTTKAGYVERYGSANGTAFYGAGGEAIYEADKACLDQLQARYEAAVRRAGRAGRAGR
jgi:hypothetical protein